MKPEERRFSQRDKMLQAWRLLKQSASDEQADGQPAEPKEQGRTE